MKAERKKKHFEHIQFFIESKTGVLDAASYDIAGVSSAK